MRLHRIEMPKPTVPQTAPVPLVIRRRIFALPVGRSRQAADRTSEIAARCSRDTPPAHSLAPRGTGTAVGGALAACAAERAAVIATVMTSRDVTA